MNSVTELWANWDKLHAILRKPQNNFHPACDSCIHAACCYEPVFSDEAEADYILASLTPEQLAELKQAVQHWYQRASLSGVLLLEEKGLAFPYRDVSLPCPFLKDGRCSIYEHRPIACRTHYALENPDNCKMPARRFQKYAIWEQNEAYQHIVMLYAMGVGVLRMDHFGLLLYNRLFGKSEKSAAASHYEIEEVKA